MMSITREDAQSLALGSAFVCGGASMLSWAGLLHPLAAAMAIVITFPLFVVFLGLAWMARKKEADMPFLGY